MFCKLKEKYGEDFNWFEPKNKAAFAQLKKELIFSHPLFGISIKAVGKNSRNDDVLFCDETDFYIIHLTWTTGTKDYPKYKKYTQVRYTLFWNRIIYTVNTMSIIYSCIIQYPVAHYV